MHPATGTYVCLTAVLFLARPASADEQPVSPPHREPQVWETVDTYVEARRAAARIPGVALAIVEEDQIVYLKGYGTADDTGRPVTPQTPFVLGSVSKAFTALAVMQLVEAGEVDLDQPVRRYLPWFRVANEAASKAITVRELLYQTSGLSLYAGRRLLADPDASDGALERHVRALADTRLSSAPGTQYEYSNANYTTAGLIVQTVSGTTYEEYVRQHIFAPLEMHNSYALQAAAERHGLAVGHRMLFGRPVAANLPFTRGEAPAAYLCSSAEDMAHWMIAQLDEGQFGGKSILSPAGIEALHKPPPGNWYAMGWAQSSAGDLRVLMHLGEVPNYRAQILLAPSAKIGIVALMNANTYLDQQRLIGIPNGVLSILIGKTPPEPPAASLMPFVYAAVAIAVAAQLLILIWSLRLLRRWRQGLEKLPENRHLRAAYVLVPFLLDATVVATVTVIVPDCFSISLTAMLLYQPDVSWICLGLAAFSAIWGTTRTLLFVRCFARHGTSAFPG